jgi:hypothetical protein
MPGVGVDHTVPGADHDTRVIGCRGLFLRTATGPGPPWIRVDLVEHPFDAVEHRFERPLRHETTMEHEGEPHAQVGGDARRHGQHHEVDRGPRGRRTRVPVLRRAGAGVQAAGPGCARDAQAVVVVPAVRDHLGDLTRREARGRAEPGGAVAGHATGAGTRTACGPCRRRTAGPARSQRREPCTPTLDVRNPLDSPQFAFLTTQLMGVA